MSDGGMDRGEKKNEKFLFDPYLYICHIETGLCFRGDCGCAAGGQTGGDRGCVPGGKPFAGGFAGSLCIWGCGVCAPVLPGGGGYDRGGSKGSRRNHYIQGGGADGYSAGDGRDHGYR